MKYESSEKIIENMGIEVYPITFIKFLLNRKKILSYFEKASRENFEIRGIKYKVNNSECELCNSKKDSGIICRQHTSINRVLSGNKVAYDIDTETLFFKNEIFKKVKDDRMVIIYCPHPKLIKEIGEEYTDSNVRKINPITIDDQELKLSFEEKVNFSSKLLLEKNIKCWFNDIFSIVTIPDKSKQFSNWCLIPNKI